MVQHGQRPLLRPRFLSAGAVLARQEGGVQGDEAGEDVPVTVAVEPLYAGANGALQLAVDMPAEYWHQLR